MGDNQSPKHPLSMFTLAGRLLVLATLLILGGIFFWFVMFVKDEVERGTMPSGSYPIAFLLIPGVTFAGLFFGVLSLILEKLGVQIWSKSDSDDDNHA